MQWRSGVTAQRFRSGSSHDNSYPAADTGRYWTGQLAAGRFAGILAEHDPNGQLRVRLLYAPAGQVRLISLYYPATWFRYELIYEGLIDSSQVVRSQPYWQAQWLGHSLLEQFYDGNLYNWQESGNSPSRRSVYRVVPVPHLRPPTACLQAPLPLVILPATALRFSAKDAFNPLHRSDVSLAWPSPPSSKYGREAEQRYQRAFWQRLRRGRTRHLLGQTDTLTGTFRQERQRINADSSGRSVQTAHTQRTYTPYGSLSSSTYKRRRYDVERTYEHGRLVSYRKTYRYSNPKYDGRQRTREWDDQGRLLYDARTDRYGTTRSRRRDRKGHLPLRRQVARPIQTR